MFGTIRSTGRTIWSTRGEKLACMASPPTNRWHDRSGSCAIHTVVSATTVAGSKEPLRKPFERTGSAETTGVAIVSALQAEMAHWAIGRAPTVRPISCLVAARDSYGKQIAHRFDIRCCGRSSTGKLNLRTVRHGADQCYCPGFSEDPNIDSRKPLCSRQNATDIVGSLTVRRFHHLFGGAHRGSSGRTHTILRIHITSEKECASSQSSQCFVKSHVHAFSKITIGSRSFGQSTRSRMRRQMLVPAICPNNIRMYCSAIHTYSRFGHLNRTKRM